MKFIFLDIDGVLNLKHYRKKLTEYLGREELFLNDIYDSCSMINLRELVIYSHAKIILTSIRRYETMCIDKFKSNLMLYDIDIYYKGVIPIGERNQGIRKVIDINKLQHYLILDSEKYVDKKLSEKHIYIDPNRGITKEIKDKCISNLTFM